MDPRRFDSLVRSLAATKTRRGLLGSLAALGAGLVGARGVANAQVTQVSCGNQLCASNPGGCKPGCVCCLYTNAVGQVTNSRCRPPGTCAPGTQVGGTPTTTTTTPPSTTTTTTATPVISCGGLSCLPTEDVCLPNGTCADTCVCGGPGNCEPCPAGCVCSTDSVEGPQRCIPSDVSCATITQPCTSTAECPTGRHCQIVPCGPGGANSGFCVLLCTSTPHCPNLTCAGNCCQPGQDACLANGSCADTCVCGGPGNCEACQPGCVCSTDSVEGPQRCIPSDVSCATITQACTSTAQCPRGQHCQIVPCGPSGANSGFCVPLCGAT